MFSQRLRELRMSRGLDQKDVAKAIGVLDATVSMWETGKRVPYYDLLVKLANFFDVSVDYLLGNDGVESATEKELKEKNALKSILVNSGYMDAKDDLLDAEVETLLDFVKINKKYIRKDIPVDNKTDIYS